MIEALRQRFEVSDQISRQFGLHKVGEMAKAESRSKTEFSAGQEQMKKHRKNAARVNKGRKKNTKFKSMFDDE